MVAPFQCVAWRLFILPACIFSEGKTKERLHAKLHLSFSPLLYVDSLLVKTPGAYCSRQGLIGVNDDEYSTKTNTLLLPATCVCIPSSATLCLHVLVLPAGAGTAV